MSENDVLGWQNTRWGMTEAEILDAMPNTLTKGKTDDFGDYYSPIGIERVKIGEHDFVVQLQMLKTTKRLERVLISRQDDISRLNKSIKSDAARILSERFGPSKRSGTSDELLWEFPTTTISIKHLFIEDVMSVIFILFQRSSIRPQSIPAF